MNCHYCQGIDTFHEVKTQYSSISNKQSILIENFPVFECIQCGEQILSNLAMDILDSIYTGKIIPTSFKLIPVYDNDNLVDYFQKIL